MRCWLTRDGCARCAETPKPKGLREVRLPRYIGLGDVVQAAIHAVLPRVPFCEGCRRRRNWLNRAVPFVRRDSPQFVCWSRWQADDSLPRELPFAMR